MVLADFFNLVTGLKTACTHAGLTPAECKIEIWTSGEGRISEVVVTGTGVHGDVILKFKI